MGINLVQMICVDGQVRFVCLVRSVRLQTDNLRLFLGQQRKNDKLPFARWADGKRIKENHLGFGFWFGTAAYILIYSSVSVYIRRFAVSFSVCSRNRKWPFSVYFYIYRYIETAVYICLYIYIYIYGKQNWRKTATSICLLWTENENSKFPFVCCIGKRKTEVCFPSSANEYR